MKVALRGNYIEPQQAKGHQCFLLLVELDEPQSIDVCVSGLVNISGKIEVVNYNCLLRARLRDNEDQCGTCN